MKKKRFLAILLTLGLLIGMLPASLLAATTSSAETDETAAVSDDESSDDSGDADYIGDSSYHYESTSFTDDDVSDYDADDSSDYSWSASATSDYYTMSGYYYAGTNSSNETTYYQVYYKVTTSSSTDDDGNTTTAIASVTLYYTTDGSTYTEIGTVSSSTGINLYKAYIDSVLDYDALYAAINGTLSESSSSNITDLTILRGYRYLYNGTLYYVYYLYTAPSTTDGTSTAASITLYYSSSASATSTSDCTQLATLTSGGTTTVTLYTEFELNISAYENTAQVFWDLDDSSGTYNNYDGDDGDSSYITSVTMLNTNTDAAQTVTFGESTNTTDYSAGTSSDSSYEWKTPTGGLTLSSVYVDSDGAAVSDAAYADEKSTLSITPAEGYYVSQVIIACAPYAGKSTDSNDNDDDDDDSGDNGGNNNGGGTPGIPDEGGDGGEGGGTGGEGGGGGGGTGGGGYGVSEASDESETETETGSEAETEAGSETEAEVESESETEAESGEDSETEAAAASETEAAAASETEASAASEDDLVTAAENTGRLSPYQCSTYVTGQAYEGTFTLSDSTASSSGYTLTIDLSNEYFAHSGALATEETQVYFILIKVAAVPTPAYVEYDYGDIVSYISAYNEANKLTSSTDEGYVDSSIFTSNADGWTDTYTVSSTDDDGNTTTSDGNVYTDNSSNSYSGTITGNGGVLTDDTQYEYVYDTKGSTKTSNWKHYANSVTNDAIKAAAAAGYVFAGWAVTWYADAKVTTGTDGTYTKTTSNYNYYTITFSNALYTSLRTEGTEVQVVGHVRLVAQWVKADNITQVIDYGLPVSTDVAEENGDDLALEAITSSVSSRTSSETGYSSATTTTLSTEITDIKYEVTTTTTSTDEDGGETTSTSTDYDTTAAGTYGDFSVDGDDNGTAIYTLNTEMTGVESVGYQVTLRYVAGSGSSATTTELCSPTGTLYIIPATSMYYEESFGVTYASYKKGSVTYENTVRSDAGGKSGSSSSSKTGGLIDYYWGGAYWVFAASDVDEGDNGGTTATTSTVGTTAQETGIVGTADDSTYGADEYYLSESNLGDSDGSSMYVDTSNYAASFTYTFTGDGTAIYTRTLDDSDSQEGAYIRVIIWEGGEEGTIPTTSDDDTETTVEEGYTDGDGITAVGTWFIDTRIVDSVSNSSTLYNIPIFSETNLDYGTYTVSVLVYKEGAPVLPTYTTNGQENDGGEATLTRAYSDSETTTDEDNEEAKTYDYLYYVYQDVTKDGTTTRMQLYYQLDSETGEVDYDSTGTTETDYPVYYTSTSSDLVSYTVSSNGEITENKSTTSTKDDEDEESSSTTYYLAALYFLADDTSGGDFYLDGVRIYNPLGTASDYESEDEESTEDTDEGAGTAEDETDEEGSKDDTETSTSSSLSDWDIASAAYEEDNEANNVVINIARKLAADAEEGYTGSDSFITLTDYYGDISGYDPDDTADYPDNEIYLDGTQSSEDEDEDGESDTESTEGENEGAEEDSTTYSVSFYLAVDESTNNLSNYDVYLGLKAPDGTSGSVKINNTEVSVNSSADCYYLLDDYLKNTTVSTITLEGEDGEKTDTLYGYKVTITGNSGLIALTYIKVVGSDEFDIAYSSDVNAGDEYSEGENDGSTDNGTESDGDTDDSGTETTAVSTLYLLSAASVEAEDEDDEATDEEMLDDDSMAVDPDDSDSDSDTDSESDDTENGDEDSLFEPETFSASITYLKLLRYASITVKTSTDVSYITVNGEEVTGRSSGLGKTLTFSYTASKVSSGTEFEIIAYDSSGTASEPITLTAK